MNFQLFSLYNNNSPFVTTPEKKYSFSEILMFANSLSFHLNFSSGTRVGIFLGHDQKFVVSLLAMWIKGITPVPLGNIVNQNQISKISEDLHLSGIIGDENSEKLIPDNLFIPFTQHNNEIPLENLHKFSPDETAVIMLTSGSSGKAKAVPLSFSNLFASLSMMSSKLPEIKNCKWFASLPFFHIGGFMIIMRSLYFGVEMIIPKIISTFEITNAIKKGQAEAFSIVPSTLENMLEKGIAPGNNVKFIFLGGAPAGKNTVLAALEKKYPIFKVYGSTETSSMISIATPDELRLNPVSSGRALDEVDIFITNSNGNFLAPEEIGDVELNSPTISSAFLAEHFSRKVFNTGDIGYLTKSGHLVITGRKSRMLISGGYNIFPEEIEAIIKEIFQPENVFVTGVCDKKWGELLVALLVTDNQISYEVFKASLKNKLPFYKIPKKVFFTEHLPLTSIGKPDINQIQKIITSKL